MPALPLVTPHTEESKSRAALRERSAGFSLTEVLVTLSITALASTMIVATARPSDPLNTEAEKLTHTLERLQSQAQISGAPMGLVLEPQGYAVVTWRDGKWAQAEQQRHELASGVRLRGVLPATASGAVLPEPQIRPAIILDPLGHSNIAPIILAKQGREVSVPIQRSGEPR